MCISVFVCVCKACATSQNSRTLQSGCCVCVYVSVIRPRAPLKKLHDITRARAPQRIDLAALFGCICVYFVYIRIYVGVCLCVRGCVCVDVCTTQDLDGMMELTHAERVARI